MNAERTATRRERLQPDERRRQILRCAREHFTTREYAAVSMEDIAVAAGVRRGLLNHYFGSKRKLYLAVIKDILAQFARAFPLPAAVGPIDDLVAEHVEQWLKVVEQEADAWLAVVATQSVGRDRDVERLVDRARDAMVEGTITALGLDGADPGLRIVLRAYAGLAEVVVHQWWARGTLDRAQAHALLSAALLSMVRDVGPAVAAATT